MQDLKINKWQDWEELCCYLMQDFVRRNRRGDVRYISYGSQGQNQYGIDLRPVNSPLLALGQCKLKDAKPFTWDDVLAELKKTDKYKLGIECYVLFTTANRHTSIQDVLEPSPYFHTRPDGSRFRVFVRYWDDVTDLSFVPANVLRRIFPSLAPSPGSSELERQYWQSLSVMKEYLPSRLTADSLAWLESWDFSQGWVIENDFAPFYDLYIDLDRVKHAASGISEWMHRKGYLELHHCRPAANRFFDALDEFISSVKSSRIIGATLPNGTSVLSVTYLADDKAKIARGWATNARYLAERYRLDILGESME